MCSINVFFFLFFFSMQFSLKQEADEVCAAVSFIVQLAHSGPFSDLLLRLPLGAAIKMAPFIVQLAQDHVVLEEKLVSHAKSLAAELTGKAV